MEKFLERFGIATKGTGPQNNKIINVFLLIFETTYFGISIFNLLWATNVSVNTLVLNCISFLSLTFMDIRKEREHLKKDDRFSLYFVMFCLEFLIFVMLAVSFIMFGFSLEHLKTALLFMLIISFINKVIKIIINLFDGE